MGRFVPLGLALLVAASACGQSSPKTPTTTTTTTTIVMTFDFQSNDGAAIGRVNDKPGAPCGNIAPQFVTPDESLQYMKAGADVVVTNAQGTIVANAALPVGITSNLVVTHRPYSASFTCTWSVGPVSLPASTFYTVSVQGNRVGTLNSTSIANGKASLSLDNDI